MAKRYRKAQVSEPAEGEYIPRRGRPSMYTPELGDRVITYMADGKSIVSVCKELNISRDTFYRWCKEHPEFKEKVQEGLTYAEAWWEDLGLAGMMGKIEKFNPTLYIHRVNSQFKWQSPDSKGNTINIENLQINSLSGEDLDKRIEALQKQLQLIEGVTSDVTPDSA